MEEYHIFYGLILLLQGLFLPLFAESPPIITPIASQSFLDLRSYFNTQSIRQLSRPG